MWASRTRQLMPIMQGIIRQNSVCMLHSPLLLCRPCPLLPMLTGPFRCNIVLACMLSSAAITVGVLAVPPVVMWVDKFEWKWPEIYFVVSINFALAVYL